MERSVHNFYAGPAVLPVEALKRAQDEFFNFMGTGISVMEISHRSKEFEKLNNEAISLIRELLHLPENYKILFLQGGASLQFSMIPKNFLQGKSADYIITGGWSQKALKEAKLFGTPREAASSKESNFNHIPDPSKFQLDPHAQYVHITSNNTLFGTQWKEFPRVGNVPLIADMSSDMLWRPFDASQFSMIYAGAQKNLGPSGVTLVIIRDDLLAKCPEKIETMLSYKTHAENNSLYNTPPTFGIYMLRNVLAWIKGIGGLKEVERRNIEKGNLIYGAIDEFNFMYKGHAQKKDRSYMNITFTLPTPELEKKFIQEAESRKFIGLKGHRDVGGCRASVYNACPKESCEALAHFMSDFARKNR